MFHVQQFWVRKAKNSLDKDLFRYIIIPTCNLIDYGELQNGGLMNTHIRAVSVAEDWGIRR